MSQILVRHGDCLEILPTLEEGSIDAVVTDPPYHLTSITKRLGKTGSKPIQFGTDGAYARAAKGFLGKEWDGGDIAFRKETWVEVLRVMKPGAHMCAFGGTRTFHNMVTAIEMAGFEIRDTIVWLYGQGFPKSKNQGAGRGTALKPANELIVLARKPLAGTVVENIASFGTGTINIDGCRIPINDTHYIKRYKTPVLSSHVPFTGYDPKQKKWGVKDCHELSPRFHRHGRWPANVICDDSDSIKTALEEFSVGSSAFFYNTKADKQDRWGSKHPTVKPIDLMAYLTRLITPPNGTVLDPFAGSGTTGIACLRERFKVVLIEREAEYVADINERIKYYTGQGKHKLQSKNRNASSEVAAGQDTPLFKGAI